MATAAEPPLPTEGTEKSQKDTDGPSTSKPQKEKKIGHRRVDATTGQTTYKRTPSSALSCAIQLGISHTVGGIISKPERDVLLQDFQVVETTSFPSEGSNVTPAHHYDDFRFKTYAPVAFRYFRDLFGILPADFMISISAKPLTELSNPGASGSLFFVTHDDEFIIKTVQHKEAEFLQKLLPGYYMNLVQNPRTLLPKFYGLYCIQAGGKNIRMVVMNNLLPRHLKMHLKFDLKGSTFKRKASKNERGKKSPTFKDLDILTDLPDGILMETDIYAAFMKTMQRDCLVLRSFKIMDYSLLLGIHYVDRDKPSTEDKGSQTLEDEKRRSNASDSSEGGEASASLLKRDHSKRNTPTDSIMSATLLRDRYSSDLELWSGGIPAKSSRGDKLLLFCGLIDILQCYKFKKKLEHTWKAMVYDGDSVSVHRPGFYCDRFQKFMSDHVFKKEPGPIKMQPTKRRAQTSRKPNDGFMAGVSYQPSNPSPLTRSKTSPAQTGKKLQSDRPDLLPSESPRPNYTEEPEDDDVTAGRQYGVSRTPPRMQIPMENRKASYSASEDAQAPSQQIQRITNFSTRSNDTETTTTVARASSRHGSASGEEVGVNQVQLRLFKTASHSDVDKMAGGESSHISSSPKDLTPQVVRCTSFTLLDTTSISHSETDAEDTQL